MRSGPLSGINLSGRIGFAKAAPTSVASLRDRLEQRSIENYAFLSSFQRLAFFPEPNSRAKLRLLCFPYSGDVLQYLEAGRNGFLLMWSLAAFNCPDAIQTVSNLSRTLIR
jgi:hypothetical protein